jgi:hypothetical protein
MPGRKPPRTVHERGTQWILTASEVRDSTDREDVIAILFGRAPVSDINTRETKLGA